jgi:Sulfotransferase family
VNNILNAPVVIGGVGGSGTRVIARIVRRAGYFLGTNLTGAEDAVEFWEFYDRWINRFLLRKQVPLSREERILMKLDWERRLARHLLVLPSPDSRWGWKNPRSILLLAFFHETYPDMKFIHVVRDGRDMAFSATAQDQCRMHGAALCRENRAASAVETAAFWSETNLMAAQYAETNMQNGYLRIKFETLCAKPRESVEELLSFLGDKMSDACQIAAEHIILPETIGRWRECTEGNLLEEIQLKAQDALQKFGYC